MNCRPAVPTSTPSGLQLSQTPPPSAQTVRAASWTKSLARWPSVFTIFINPFKRDAPASSAALFTQYEHAAYPSMDLRSLAIAEEVLKFKRCRIRGSASCSTLKNSLIGSELRHPGIVVSIASNRSPLIRAVIRVSLTGIHLCSIPNYACRPSAGRTGSRSNAACTLT